MTKLHSIWLIFLPMVLAGCGQSAAKQAPAEPAPDLAAQPVQERLATEREPLLVEPGIKSLRDAVSGRPTLEEVRIQIFPHWGKYATPQGRETNISSITLKNANGCTAIPEPASNGIPSAGRPTPDGATPEARSGTQLGFTHASLTRPVRVVCNGGSTQLVREAPLNSYTYAGSFLIERFMAPEGQTGLRVVNVIPFDTYLKGVIPIEMPVAWSLETLKVQAVAARTYGYFEILNARAAAAIAPRSYDVDDTVQYQAYTGTTAAVPRSDQAVDDTRSQVMLHEGKVIKAFFGADTGGYTEDPVNVWGGNPMPYLISKPEEYSLEAFKTNWEKLLSLEDITLAFRTNRFVPANASVTAIEVRDAERLKSLRATQVYATLSDGTTAAIGANEVRFALKLRSTMFWVTPDADGKLVFKGRGYGHGVGMNQWGAKALVETLNWDYARILRFYYENIELCVDGESTGQVPSCAIR